MKFCEKLILLRKRRGMTQEEFSRAVGVSRQSVYKWESGQSYPEAAKLLEIRKLYGVSIDHLLDETETLSFPEEKRTEKVYERVPHAQIYKETPSSAPIREEEPTHEPAYTPAPAPRAAEETPAVTRPAPQTVHTQPARVSVSDHKKKKKQNPLLDLVGSIFGKRR